MTCSFLLYFGSAIVPVWWLLVRRGKPATRWLLCGLAAQCVLAVALAAWMECSGRAGYTEYYWLAALHIPVNVTAGPYYGTIIWLGNGNRLRPASQHDAERPALPSSPESP